MEQANRERFPISPVETSSNACPRASPRRLEYLLTRPNRREREEVAPTVGNVAGLRYLAFRSPVAPHAGQASPPAPGLSSLADPCHPQSQPQSARRRPSLAGPLEPSRCFRRCSWACAVAPVRARLPSQAGSRLGSGLSSPTGATSAPCRDGDGDVLARAGIENGQGHRSLHITNRRPTLAVPSPACGKAQSQ